MARYKLTDHPIRAKAKRLVRHFWRKACEFDGIEPDSSFVIWSKGNPYEAIHNRAMTLYMAICRQHKYYPNAEWH